MPENEMIPFAEARRQVEVACRRLGLLHLAFAETLVKEFGEEKGKQLTVKAIEHYSRTIGEAKKAIAKAEGFEPTPENHRRLRDIPTFGIHERAEQVEVNGEKRSRAWGCALAKVWRQYGRDDLGRIYCYVDPASAMFLNADFKISHTKCVPDGDPYCELAIRPTSAQERRDFAAGKADWKEIDKG